MKINPETIKDVIGSGGKLNIDTSNFLLKSDVSLSANEELFRLGTAGAPALSYKKGKLTVTGDITASSFTLANNATVSGLSTSDISGMNDYALKTEIPDPDDFTVNGIGWTKWPSSSNNYYVSLTSTADSKNVKGILIGVSQASGVTQHLIIPYSASNTKSVVDISKAGIYFDYYNSTPSTNTSPSSYIHMDSTGLNVKGNRITITEGSTTYPVWARDDIIVLKNGDNETAIINSMVNANKHDWVLIKPYYDALIRYQTRTTMSLAISAERSAQLAQNGGEAAAFGNATGSNAYKYRITGTGRRNTGQGNLAFTFSLANEELSNSTRTSAPVIIEKTVNNVSYGSTFTIQSDWLSSSYNLCSEGALIYIYVYVPSTDTIGVDLVLECKCNATTSRVPCTVYYYP